MILILSYFFGTEQAESYKAQGNVYQALYDIEAALADYESYVSLILPGPE